MFSIPVLPGQRRRRHDPSRSFPVDLRCQHGSTRFTQVGLPFPVLQGSPRWFLTCQKPPERPPVHPGPSGIILVRHCGTTVQPPVLPVHPGTWTGVNRGVPGAQWDWGITWKCGFCKINKKPRNALPVMLDCSQYANYRFKKYRRCHSLCG